MVFTFLTGNLLWGFVFADTILKGLELLVVELANTAEHKKNP